MRATKRSVQILAAITIVLVSFVSLRAQTDTPRPDGWRGLVLNVSTPDDAIRLFGPPAKDKDKTALDPVRPLSWLSDKYKQKVFRTLTYKKLHGYKQVQLSFHENKLVLVSMRSEERRVGKEW